MRMAPDSTFWRHEGVSWILDPMQSMQHLAERGRRLSIIISSALSPVAPLNKPRPNEA